MAGEEFGFDPALGDEELARRHRDLVRRFHPDAHPHAPPAERAALERRMQAVNEAWARVRRTEPASPPRGQEPAPPRAPRTHAPPPRPAPPAPAAAPPSPAPSPAQPARRRGRWLAATGAALAVGIVTMAALRPDEGDRSTAIPPGCPMRTFDRPLATIDGTAQEGRTVVLAGTIDNPYDAPLRVEAVVVQYRYRTFANLPRDDTLEISVTSPPLQPGQSERFRWTGTVVEAGNPETPRVADVESAWAGPVSAACPIR